MPEFSKWSDLEKYLKKQIKDALANEVKSEVVETERRHVQKDVYEVYNPKMYKRRKENGGLMDEKNIVGVMLSDDTLEVENKTPANPYGIPQERVTTEGKNLPGLIEFGDDNGYGRYDFPPSDGEDDSYMFPRPFISNTVEELKNSKAHISALANGLLRHNIKTEN